MSEHDYVIVGAGAAGCVLANRLSAGGASVCLLESGGSDRHLGVKAPAAFPTLFQTTRDWNLLSEPEPGLHGRRWYLPRGRMLGGSSSMNAMFYVRGHRSDFDRWVEDFGAVGWSYDEVLPLFKRSEHNEEISDAYHGTTGELNVTRKRWLSRYWEPYIEAAVHWRSDPSLPAPDFQIVQAPVYFWEHGFRKTGAPAFTIGTAYLGPQSRGEVTLRSADPEDHPRVVNNALTQDSEVDAMLRAIGMAREIASKQPLAGRLGEELNPSAGIRSREQLVDWLRATCEHEYHPSCTCRIGSPEEGVVDPELRVHGVEGLRVADASVQPRIVSANTQAITLVIAERCADLVLGRTPAAVG